MSDNTTEERLIRIETALAHLQHDIESLNSSLTGHFRRLQSFEERFVRIEHELCTLTEGPDASDPESEKPPHY
ncbi:MAG: SlyX family protein [Planctomycetaceae bacterium]